MTSLKTRFFGLELKNPLVIASSSLTADPDKVKAFSDNGAGAIVLKSVFEEEIINEYNQVAQGKSDSHFDEFMDYFDYKIRDQVLATYGRLIKSAKEVSQVPVIASINCISAGDWLQFASQVQDAGADAIELNLFVMPFDPNRKAEDTRRFYLDTVKEISRRVKIPVAVKISSYFSDLASICNELDGEKLAGITLFNRFSSPDIDIDKEQVIEAGTLSNENEYLLPLRWTGILSPRLKCPIAASTGVHDAKHVIKMLLAGASAVQMASVFYKKGPAHVAEILKGLETWMDKKGYESLGDFKGRLSLTKAANPALYERAQYMSNFGGYAGS
ncbi:MAG: dihydroorotate dehydrogenase-like protein [Candidatus Riflebacteria bacterium]|jgi:dihydroorotate dehydrogenase (fumarate)|nr:dihydroorotate dehydrogenase-like protein [Candidatus Riflebacteria bacterium]